MLLYYTGISAQFPIRNWYLADISVLTEIIKLSLVLIIKVQLEGVYTRIHTSSQLANLKIICTVQCVLLTYNRLCFDGVA